MLVPISEDRGRRKKERKKAKVGTKIECEEEKKKEFFLIY